MSQARGKPTVLEAAGREVVITNPDKVFFPQRRAHQARPGAVLRGGRRGRAARHRGAADRAQALRQRRRRASRSSRSARPSKHPDWVETVELRFPSGRTAREVVVRDAAQLLWIVNLGCIDLNPHPVRADDLDHPDELRVDLDPGPGVGWDDVRQVALVVREVLDEHGLRGWPKTSGSRGIHVNVRIERALELRPGAARGAGAGARGGAARARARDQQVVEGGAPRRLPRLQPERQGPHGGVGVVGAADARRARVDAARVGRGRRLRSGGVHAGDRAGALRRARRRGGRHRRAPRARSRRCSSCPRRRRPQGLGDAPWPPHYQKQRRRAAARVAPSRRKGAKAAPASARTGEQAGKRQRPPAIDAAAHHRREGAAQGRRARRARALEGAPSRGRGAAAGRRRPRRRDARPLDARGRASASTCATCPRPSGPPRSRPIPTTIPGAARGPVRATPRAPKTRSSS